MAATSYLDSKTTLEYTRLRGFRKQAVTISQPAGHLEASGKTLDFVVSGQT